MTSRPEPARPRRCTQSGLLSNKKTLDRPKFKRIGLESDPWILGSAGARGAEEGQSLEDKIAGTRRLGQRRRANKVMDRGPRRTGEHPANPSFGLD